MNGTKGTKRKQSSVPLDVAVSLSEPVAESAVAITTVAAAANPTTEDNVSIYAVLIPDLGVHTWFDRFLSKLWIMGHWQWEQKEKMLVVDVSASCALTMEYFGFEYSKNVENGNTLWGKYAQFKNLSNQQFPLDSLDECYLTEGIQNFTQHCFKDTCVFLPSLPTCNSMRGFVNSAFHADSNERNAVIVRDLLKQMAKKAGCSKVLLVSDTLIHDFQGFDSNLIIQSDALFYLSPCQDFDLPTFWKKKLDSDAEILRSIAKDKRERGFPAFLDEVYDWHG